MKLRELGFFVCGAIATGMLALATAATSSDRGVNTAQSIAAYQRLLAKAPVYLDAAQARVTKGVMQRSMQAHHRRDTDAAIAELGEQYAWMHVVEEGAVEMASGKEIVEERTRLLYEKSDFLKNYLGSDAKPLAIVGNLGVQLETENFRNPDGSRKQTKSLSIYEIKDGKLWRLWAFAIPDANAPKSN